MIDHLLNLLALRAVVTGCVAATTGSTELASTATSYTRVSGSFIADGFVAGMEVVPYGFANAEPRIVTGVAALQLTTKGGAGSELGEAGRVLLAGAPPLRAWEGSGFTPVEGRWHLEEDYLPGPASAVTLGPGAQIEGDPMYVLKLYSVTGYGVSAAYKVADAFLALFPPNLAIPLPSGDVLRVRSNPAPYRGQLTTRSPGRAVVVVTIPLRLRTTSTI